MSKLLIYGATGYTGRMVAKQAKVARLDFAIAGRDAAKLAALALELDVPYEAFALEDTAAVVKALRRVAVVLNCAGPFAHTAKPLMRSCIEAGFTTSTSRRRSTFISLPSG